MKKRILILLGILIIGGGAAAGVCWKMGVFGQQETSGDSGLHRLEGLPQTRRKAQRPHLQRQCALTRLTRQKK